MTVKREDLPRELRAMVKQAVALLGNTVRRELGESSFVRIEKIRREMTRLRGQSVSAAHQTLKNRLRQLRALTGEERLGVAHAFSLMLELMNACESAYRTFRLRQRAALIPGKKVGQVVYVLTAHPTEARSPAIVSVFHQIQSALVDAYAEGFDKHERRIAHLIEVAWHVDLARRRRPRVEDEAEHIYSIVLRDDVLSALLSINEELAPTFIRSWVGGDKDGHPGVNEKVMIGSFQLAREHLLRFVKARLTEVRATMKLVRESRVDRRLGSALAALEKKSLALGVVRSSDASRILSLRGELRRVSALYQESFGELHPSLLYLERLLRLFPGLVVPLELRESSDVIMRAVKGERTAIARMIRGLAAVSKGGDPRWYARGLIISMTSSFAHINAAAKMLRKDLGGMRIPLIPLFEQQDALMRSPEIVKTMLANRGIQRALRERWNNYFEIMLGYSDSAKEMGALASRLAIAETMSQLDRLLRGRKVIPVFFHGAGGSVDRGGGSIQEQTAWWPRSSLRLYKATLQGEMVERSLASPEIARSRIEHIVERMLKPGKSYGGSSVAVRDFAEAVSHEYRAMLSSPGFFDLVQCATAYRYLSVLRIGSRPSKRKNLEDVSGLRAIPWVLSWTQTRILFPTWWGVGVSWRCSDAGARRRLRIAFRQDPLFRSYVKILGFTLAKIELPVWRMYVEESGLPPDFVRSTLVSFEKEYKDAVRFVREVSGESELVWFRPWLATSIRLRSPMIHPLNLLQIIAFKSGDNALIRETVTGIASGMMTTG